MIAVNSKPVLPSCGNTDARYALAGRRGPAHLAVSRVPNVSLATVNPDEAIGCYGRVVASYAWPDAFDEAWHAVSRDTGVPMVVARDTAMRIQPEAPSLWPPDMDIVLAQQFAKRGITLTRYGVTVVPETNVILRTHLSEGDGFFVVDDAEFLWGTWETLPWQMERSAYVARRAAKLLAEIPNLFAPAQAEWRIRAICQTLTVEHYTLVLRALRARKAVDPVAMDYPLPSYCLGADYPGFVARRLDQLRRQHAAELDALRTQPCLPQGRSRVVGKLNGEPAWSDGHLMLLGDRPPEEWNSFPVRIYPSDFDGMLPAVPWEEANPVGVIQIDGETPGDYVVFASPDGARVSTIHGGYYGYTQASFPGAQFMLNPHAPAGPLEIRQKAKRIGAVMPFQIAEPVSDQVRSRFGLPLR